MSESALQSTIYLAEGDCRTILADVPENHFHACITDPPYSLGFMNRSWDKTGIANDPATWAAVFRVMRPGAHLIAFGGTRTWHRMTCAIEDAGFEIRDCLMWLYGQGFPKSHNVSKAIDKHMGLPREIIGVDVERLRRLPRHDQYVDSPSTWQDRGRCVDITVAASLEAAEWESWGSALKPAVEPIILARKPLDGTLASSTLKWGCGGLNIDACRVPVNAGADASQLRTMNRGVREHDTAGQVWGTNKRVADNPQVIRPEGRWPANLLLEDSEEVLAGFPDAPGQQGDLVGHAKNRPTKTAFGNMGPATDHLKREDSETSAARFFSRFEHDSETDSNERPGDAQKGRWPANVAHDGSEEVLSAFESYGITKDGVAIQENGGGQKIGKNAYMGSKRVLSRENVGYGGSGSPARFFYCAKVAGRERGDCKHPTMKPLALMEWLVRLVCPPGAAILDPFAGSGTTGLAASRVDPSARIVLIEQDPGYCEEIRKRMAASGFTMRDRADALPGEQPCE